MADQPQEKKEKLVLIDAHALIHRSFHAIPPLTKNGQQVNAVYGFTSTVLSVLAELKPKYIAVVFDAKGPTFRHQEFTDYKAKRPPAPEALIAQFTIANQLMKDLSIPVFSLTGFEADDLIGTLAMQAKNKNLLIIIVTGDHDMYQLIDDGKIVVYNVSRGAKNGFLVDKAVINDQYGFDPQQMIDYKALSGDISDNIPGVKGIGEVTAKKLIQQFGSLAEIYRVLDCPSPRTDNMKASIQTKLCQGKDQALLSQRLVTIKIDAPIKLELEHCLVDQYDEDRAKKALLDLGFRSLVPRLPKIRTIKQQSLF